MKTAKIVILATGGTIAGTAATGSDNIGYVAAQIGIEAILDATPGLGPVGNLITEQVSQIDSKDMSLSIWVSLVERLDYFLARDDVDGVVITHGTDTLEETAFFLQSVLNPLKPVVLTGAMRPASSLNFDGAQNLRDSVAVARHKDARGVVVVFAGVIHSALDVQKIHPYQLSAFGSGDAGPVGYVEENELRLLRNWPQASVLQGSSAIKNIAFELRSLIWPKVHIVVSHAGADGDLVQALLDQAMTAGIVVAATGNGTLHCELEAALIKAQAAGIRVVRASRCPNGRILTAADSKNPIPESKGLTPVKARISLMLELAFSNYSAPRTPWK